MMKPQSPAEWLDVDTLKIMDDFVAFTSAQAQRIPDDQTHMVKMALQSVVLMVLLRQYADHLEVIVENAPPPIKAHLRTLEASLKKKVIIVPASDELDGAMAFDVLPGETAHQAIERLKAQLAQKPKQA